MAPASLFEGLSAGISDAIGEVTRIEDGKPRWSFENARVIVSPKGHRLCEVLWGGRNPHPLVESSGENSEVVAAILRGNVSHTVSRIDVARDGRGPDLFEKMAQLCSELAVKYRIKHRAILAPTDPDAGGTIYLGSRKGTVFLRVYQKGLQIAEEMGLSGDQIPEELRHWVRAETEIKPQNKDAKQGFALVEPDAFWGAAEWLSEFSERALAMRPEPITFRQRKLSDHERALKWMAQQYRGHLERLLRDCGGDQAEAFSVLLDLANVDRLQAA